jgi:carbonic anhydrase
MVFRNVGGHVTHSLTDILALDGFLGIKSILVIHHTGR